MLPERDHQRTKSPLAARYQAHAGWELKSDSDDISVERPSEQAVIESFRARDHLITRKFLRTLAGTITELPQTPGVRSGASNSLRKGSRRLSLDQPACPSWLDNFRQTADAGGHYRNAVSHGDQR